MATLILYDGPVRVAEGPISHKVAWAPLSEAIHAWARLCRAPRVVLSEGKVAHLVSLGEPMHKGV
jgi:hypothetical protein